MYDQDSFFTISSCQRCGCKLSGGRIQSWFTEQTLCMGCHQDEKKLRSSLPDGGRNLEGCGYMPVVATPDETVVKVGERYPIGTWFYDTKDREFYKVQGEVIKESHEISEWEANQQGLYREGKERV